MPCLAQNAMSMRRSYVVLGPLQGLMAPCARVLRGIGNDQVHIEANGTPKPLADLTCTQRAVEGEQVWHRITIGNIAIRAMQVLAELLLLPIRKVHNDHALPKA
jgi:hypothetical protein